MKNEPLTTEDVRLVTSQINAALEFVKNLREYLEQTGKLRSVELKQFKTAETALHAIRLKPTISRASEMTKRINQAQQGKFK